MKIKTCFLFFTIALFALISSSCYKETKLWQQDGDLVYYHEKTIEPKRKYIVKCERNPNEKGTIAGCKNYLIKFLDEPYILHYQE